MIFILSLVLAISPLVIIHELGHYIVGKFLGAKPSKFSLGMGKVLYSKKKWGTEWRISLLPIGGYVMFDKAQFSFEMKDGKVKEKLEAWKWIPIALAGPLANFLYTVIVFFGLFFYISGGIESYNVSKSEKVIILKEKAQSSFIKNMVVGYSGEENIFLLKNQKIIPYESFEEISKSVNIEKIKNNNGIKNRLIFSLNTSISTFNFIFYETLKGVGGIFKSKDGYKAVSGPIGISQEAKKALEGGLIPALFFSALISLALGFMNLVPLIVLDGGRAILALVETITGKEPQGLFLSLYVRISFVALVVLVMASTYSDIGKFFK